MRSTSFLETQIILQALEFAAKKGFFSKNPTQKRIAQSLIQRMKSNRSVSGRHQQLITFLKKGGTVEEMMKATGSSRRTIFRYLNHLEDAGLKLELKEAVYRLTE